MTTSVRCWKCDGEGCEEGCGRRGGCQMAHSGPDSHKVCRGCGGRGRYEHDCGHLCCDERHDPHHSHFLDPKDCTTCKNGWAVGDGDAVEVTP